MDSDTAGSAGNSSDNTAIPAAPTAATPPVAPDYSHDVLQNMQFPNKLSGLAKDPKITGYMGKATKLVAACAISGCLLLIVAIFAAVNLLNQVTSAIHP